MSAAYCLRRVNLERGAYGQHAGKYADDDYCGKAAERLPGLKQDKLGEYRSPERRGYLPHNKTDDAEADGLLEYHESDSAVPRADELQDGNLPYLSKSQRINDEGDDCRAH